MRAFIVALCFVPLLASCGSLGSLGSMAANGLVTHHVATKGGEHREARK